MHRATQLVEKSGFERRSAKVDLRTSVLSTSACRALNKCWLPSWPRFISPGAYHVPGTVGG